MTPVRLEPAAPRSRVKHSTTEPLRSHSLIFVSQGYLKSTTFHTRTSRSGLSTLGYKCDNESFSTYHIFFVCLIWFLTSQSTNFQLYWKESSWVKPALVFLKDTMQWRRWGSNPHTLTLQKAVYQWVAVLPFITYAWSHELRACAHEYVDWLQS